MDQMKETDQVKETNQTKETDQVKETAQVKEVDRVKNTNENEYTKSYSDQSLFEKIVKFAQKAGISVVYVVLLLYYTLQKSHVPGWAKSVIVGALGYFIAPMDAIPDATPFAGLSDDFGVLVAALVTVAFLIDDDVKEKARKKLKEWFGSFDKSALNEVDSKIEK